MATATKQVKSNYTVELTLSPEEAHELCYYLAARPSGPTGGRGSQPVKTTDAIYNALILALR